MCDIVSLVDLISRFMMSVCLITSVVTFDFLVKWCLLGFTTVKLLFFPFLINKQSWRDTWSYVHILFLISFYSEVLVSIDDSTPDNFFLWYLYNSDFITPSSLPIFISWHSTIGSYFSFSKYKCMCMSIYMYDLPEQNIGFYFIQWIIIHYHHYFLMPTLFQIWSVEALSTCLLNPFIESTNECLVLSRVKLGSWYWKAEWSQLLSRTMSMCLAELPELGTSSGIMNFILYMLPPNSFKGN